MQAKDITLAATGQDAANHKLAASQWDLFQVAKIGHGDYLKRAEKCGRFYLGDQWEERDQKKLDAQGRPALTINQVLPIVNVVLGEQATRRADVKFKSKKDTTNDDAAMMTRVYNWVTDENMYDWVESQVFADGVIEERGFFDIRIEFDDNLMGSIKIVSDDPGDVIPDPDAKEYDPETWNEVWYTRWASLDYVELNYGVDKRKALESLANSGTTRGQDSFLFEQTKERKFGSGDNNAKWFGEATKAEQGAVKSVRIIERQHRKLHWMVFFIDPRTGDKSHVPPTWDDARMQEFATRAGLIVHKMRSSRIRWTVTCDSVVLHDAWSPYVSFTKIPFYPYFRRGKSIGIVTSLISPQEMLNKISSQITHVVNTTANSGWIVETGVLANMTTKQLETKGAETGLVIETNPGTTAPTKITANQIPTGLERIGMNAQNNMKSISGVNDGMLGQEGAEVSGIALDSKERRGQIQMQVPLDNLAKTRHYVVRKILELVQQFVTESRILTITNDRPAPGQEPTEELAINQQTAQGILNDTSRGSYGWVIASQPARDSYNDSQFAEAMALRRENIMIPDDRVIEYTNLERKFELAEEVRQMTGRGKQSPEEQALAQHAQQMAMLREQLELAEIEAKVMKMRSEAQLNAAKGMSLGQAAQQSLDQLDADVALMREGFELRRSLSRDQNTGKLEGKVIDHKSAQALQLSDAQLELLKARNTPNQN